MDVNRIRQLLPHRYPFLLVDKIIEMGTRHIVGVKNVSGNEPFFQGHFPAEPVMRVFFWSKLWLKPEVCWY